MSRPTWARWVTRISLILGLVALVFTIRNTGLRTIADYFRRIGWWWIAVVILEIAITSLDATAIHWQFIRAVLASVADTAIVPVQDLLGLGSDARMNRPGTDTGNWRWRLVPGQLGRDTARKLAVMTQTYERV